MAVNALVSIDYKTTKDNQKEILLILKTPTGIILQNFIEKINKVDPEKSY